MPKIFTASPATDAVAATCRRKWTAWPCKAVVPVCIVTQSPGCRSVQTQIHIENHLFLKFFTSFTLVPEFLHQSKCARAHLFISLISEWPCTWEPERWFSPFTDPDSSVERKATRWLGRQLFHHGVNVLNVSYVSHANRTKCQTSVVCRASCLSELCRCTFALGKILGLCNCLLDSMRHRRGIPFVTLLGAVRSNWGFHAGEGKEWNRNEKETLALDLWCGGHFPPQPYPPPHPLYCLGPVVFFSWCHEGELIVVGGNTTTLEFFFFLQWNHLVLGQTPFLLMIYIPCHSPPNQAFISGTPRFPVTQALVISTTICIILSDWVHDISGW